MKPTKIPDTIDEKEIARRKDFGRLLHSPLIRKMRKILMMHLSIRKLGNGKWEIGVHIADVSYYIKPSSFLDKEAYSRATSVYLVDRVIPMLPENLSQWSLRSLRPEEDKLCFSAVFEMGENARYIFTLDWQNRDSFR